MEPNGYNPEEEYQNLEGPEEAAAPAESAAQAPVPEQPQPDRIPVQPTIERPAVQPQNGYQAPAYHPPYNGQQPYPYPAPPQRQGYQGYPNAPVYPQQPVQQPVQQIPTAPMQQPVQQPMQQPYPGAAYPNTPAYRQPVNPQHAPAGVPVQNSFPQQDHPQANPYQQPVQTSTPYDPNPYAQGYNPQPAPAYAPPKPATPTGTKVFIIILCALLAMMVVGFAVYVSSTAKNKNQSSLPTPDHFSIDDGDDSNPFSITPFEDNSIVDSGYTEIEDEITLIEDTGETQKRADDNPDTVGEPDEKASNIKLEPLPKDKDDEKYTTQSAYESVSDSVVTVVCYDGEITDNDRDKISQGTGTIISSDGYLITNAHVIGNSRLYAINIVLNSGDKYQAKVIGYDTWTDLAVLKIDAKGLKAVTFGDSDLIEIGQDVIAIGSPGGEKFQNSLTKGIVSAVDRELSINKYVRYIQSDAAISPGNSGGPLCNIYGQVIGITTAKTTATYYENMSFSIPSATVEEIVGDLLHYGHVQGRTRIGISGSEVSEEAIYYYNTPAGVEIAMIDESGPLAGTDVKEGDIITELDGQEIASFQDIYDVLAAHKPGDKITIKVQRPNN